MTRGLLALFVITLLTARWLFRRRPRAAPDLDDAFSRYADGGDRA